MLTLSAAAEAIARGDLSPLELTKECLARIEASDHAVQAFTHVDAEGALAAALRATDEIAASGPVGPMHGIPIAIKDLIDVAGMPTTAGSGFVSQQPAVDASCVAKLKRAGAIVIGKVNCDEFAYGVFSEPTRNPWALDRIPGGSSGGSAAAVAAGMCLGALGTDTAGSIRIPSALCGVAGFKPRAGVVATDGIIPLAPSLDSVGPIARTIEDAAIMWTALSGARISSPRGPVSIGIVEPPALEGLTTAVAEVYAAAVDALRSMSDVKVLTLQPPPFSEWERPRGYLLMVEALLVHRSAHWYPDHRDDYSEAVAAKLDRADNLPAWRYLQQMARLEELRVGLRSAVGKVTAMLLPTTPRTAPKAEELHSDLEVRGRLTSDLTRFVGPINCCPLAAATVPWALSASGLPTALDVVASDEATAMGVATRLQSLTASIGMPSVTEGR